MLQVLYRVIVESVLSGVQGLCGAFPLRGGSIIGYSELVSVVESAVGEGGGLRVRCPGVCSGMPWGVKLDLKV